MGAVGPKPNRPPVRPLKEWSVNDISYVGWVGLVVVAMLTHWLSFAWLLCAAGVYCFGGAAKLYARSMTMHQLEGLAVIGVICAWPLALQADVFKR